MKNSIDEINYTVNLVKDFHKYIEDGNIEFALACLQDVHNKIEDYLLKIGYWVENKDEKIDINKIVESYK